MFPRRILTALSTALALLILLFALGYFLGLWSELARRWTASRPPTPYRFASLKNLSDVEMFRFMSGAERVDTIHEKDAPESNFPARLWNADPKTAALDFVESNRSPRHRENYHVWLDSGTSATPPDAGWLILDTFGTQTVLRFGVEQPFLFHAATSSLWSSNPYVDNESHSLQIIPLSPDEARFLAHTVFWLGQIQSKQLRKEYAASHISSACGGGFGILEWNTDKAQPKNLEASLDGFIISDLWRGDYDEKTNLAFTDYFLAVALPEHLGKRWEKPASISRDFYTQPLAERLKSPEDPASQAQLTQRVLTALASHQKDPWPAKALVPVIEYAGEVGLSATLPALEALNSKLGQPSADEAEFTGLDARFHYTYSEPKEPAERKDWERHQALEKALKHDFSTHARQALVRTLRQLHALGDIDQLGDLSQGQHDLAMWALQQLYQLQPDAYSEALIRRFSTKDEWRGQIFSTLAELNPPAARRLRDSLDAKDQASLLFVITDFERTDDPARARTRIPALLDIAESAAVKRSAGEIHPVTSKRGPAIEMLAKLPLDPAQRQRFERVLLNELLSARHGDDFDNGTALRQAAEAVVTQPDPDTFWDALYVTASVQNGSSEFNSLLDSLANLALAKPETHLSQLTELLRQRLRGHKFSVDQLCMTALALDLRELAPEIEFYATSSPEVEDGESTSSCKNNPDSPCPHRYHSARHVIALWSEPDADTRARMWTALFHHKWHEFHGNDTLSNTLRRRFEESLNAATPELRHRLITQAASTDDLPRELAIWLGTLR